MFLFWKSTLSHKRTWTKIKERKDELKVDNCKRKATERMSYHKVKIKA